MDIIKQLLILFLGISIASCGRNGNHYEPKPYGYFRISLPQNSYQTLDKYNEPYSFEYSAFAKIEQRDDKPGEKWMNIVYPELRATIYITYHTVKNNLATIINDSHHFTYRHTIKADAITESFYAFPDKRVYGLFSELEGNAASPIQFLLTDSTRNFIRGSLYFDVETNIDSVQPVINFIKKDILHLMETTEWKKLN